MDKLYKGEYVGVDRCMKVKSGTRYKVRLSEDVGDQQCSYLKPSHFQGKVLFQTSFFNVIYLRVEQI